MIKAAIKYLIWLLIPIQILAQDPITVLREAERLEYSFKESDALAKYKEVLKLQPNNLQVLCKCSDLSSRIGHRQTNKKTQEEYYTAAKTYAEAALKVNAQSPEANFVMSVAMGRMAMLTGGKEKIQYVNEIRRYAENTLKYDPNNFKAYHVLGKWHYEVSNLSSFERTMAKLLFGGLPQASLRDAITYYEKSRALEPNFPINYLELAKAYHRNDETRKAIDMLTKLQTVPNRIEDDVRIKKEGKQLLDEIK